LEVAALVGDELRVWARVEVVGLAVGEAGAVVVVELELVGLELTVVELVSEVGAQATQTKDTSVSKPVPSNL